MMHKKLNEGDQENDLKEVFRVFGKDETGKLRKNNWSGVSYVPYFHERELSLRSIITLEEETFSFVACYESFVPLPQVTQHSFFSMFQAA